MVYYPSAMTVDMKDIAEFLEVSVDEADNTLMFGDPDAIRAIETLGVFVSDFKP